MVIGIGVTFHLNSISFLISLPRGAVRIVHQGKCRKYTGTRACSCTVVINIQLDSN